MQKIIVWAWKSYCMRVGARIRNTISIDVQHNLKSPAPRAMPSDLAVPGGPSLGGPIARGRATPSRSRRTRGGPQAQSDAWTKGRSTVSRLVDQFRLADSQACWL